MDADRIVQASQQSDVDRAAITAELLQAVGADPARWLPPIAIACAHFDIYTTARVQMFVAQCAHESTSFTRIRESMHYSGTRLWQVFHNHFDSVFEANEFSYDDVRIAERVYGGRMGNGAEGTGDGYAYRGGGLLQITGRAWYRRYGAMIGVDLENNPRLIEEPSTAALVSAAFWKSNGLNELADADHFDTISSVINTGTTYKPANGEQERMAWLGKIRDAA